jgi:hypothetical protein
MIYIFCGNDSKKINLNISKISNKKEVILLTSSSTSKEILINYASSTSLFGDVPVIIIDNTLNKDEFSFSKTDLSILKESPTIFIFKEDKLLVANEKKYKNYANIERFEVKEIKKNPTIKSFDIVDAFSKRDKVGTWILYRQAIDGGLEPEAISGLLFWKIKTMILNGTKVFSIKELQNQSKNIVSLYHHSHRGDTDFIVGLEQFILSSLSK